MVSKLSLMAAKVAITDLDNLKCKITSLNKIILFELVRTCLMFPRKLLALSTLIEYWPYTIFSLKLLGESLTNDEMVLIASLIKRRRIGNITKFYLLSPMHDNIVSYGTWLKCYPTNAFLDVILSDRVVEKPVDSYGKRKSQSYHEVLQSTKENKISSQNKVVKLDEEKDDYFCKMDYSNELLKVTMEIYIDNENANKVISVFHSQTTKNTSRHCICEIHAERIKFGDIHIDNLVKVLQCISADSVLSIDLSLCSLNHERLLKMCHLLQRFQKLQCVLLANNDFKEADIMTLVAECLCKSPHLNYIDLSNNSLNNFQFNKFINFSHQFGQHVFQITSLILTGCAVNISVLKYITRLHSNFPFIEYLNINDNPLVSNSDYFTLAAFIVKFQQTLKRLDIVNCGINKQTAKPICENALSYLSELKILVMYPNKDLSLKFMNSELLPLLKHLNHLEIFTPITIK